MENFATDSEKTEGTTKRDKSRRLSGKKAIRDQAVIAEALKGKTTVEIAREIGLSRQTVSGILNSDEVRKIISELDRRLAAGIEDAVNTVLVAAKQDPKVAIELLRNFGAMRAKVQCEHSVMTLEDLILGSGGADDDV